MSVEVIGIDHVVPVLGFRKGRGNIGGDPHLHYYNRQFGYSLRPAREATPDHDPYAPGLHHLRREAGVEAAEPRRYSEYDPDYYDTFFEDPNGVGLEVANFRERRRKLMHDREARAGL